MFDAAIAAAQPALCIPRHLPAAPQGPQSALTAKDRPYKKGKTLSESLTILGKFKLGGHVDPDLFDVFIWEKVYLKYAQQCMDAHQIDEVDLLKIPGYIPPPAS